MNLEELDAQYKADAEAISGRGSIVPVIKLERKDNVGYLQFIPLPVPTVGLPSDYSNVTRYEHPVSYDLIWSRGPQFILNKKLYQMTAPLSTEDSDLYDEVVSALKTLHNYEYHVSAAVKDGKEFNTLLPKEKELVDAFKIFGSTRDWTALTPVQAEVYRYLFGKEKFTSYTSGFNPDTFMYGYITDTDIAKFKDYKGSVVCILFINKRGDKGTLFHDNCHDVLSTEDKKRKKKGETDWLKALMSAETTERTISLKVALNYAGNNAYYTISVEDEDPVNIPEDKLGLYGTTNWIADLTRCKTIFDRSTFLDIQKLLRKRLSYYEESKESDASNQGNSTAAPVAQPQQVPAAPPSHPSQQTPPPAPQEAASSESNDGLPF